jgi:hypothetical protein
MDLALCFILGAIATAWIALIVQSLAGAGSARAYFASELRCHWPPDDDDTIVLDADFVFVDSRLERTVSPAGMISDGASVGPLLRFPIIGDIICRLIKGTPMTGPLRPAAIPHDCIYGLATESSFWRALIAPERARADRIIYEAAQCGQYMLASQVKRRPLARWRAFLVFAGLRAFGVFAWMGDSSKAQKSLIELAKKGA